MDTVRTKTAVRCVDPTDPFGNVEVTCETELFFRDGVGYAQFTVNGTGMDTLIQTSAKSGKIDVAKMHETSKKLTIDAFKSAKERMNKLGVEYFINPKFEKRRSDDGD